MSQENVERLRTVYEQWAKGNFRAGGELFEDDVVFRTFEAIADEDLVVHGKDGVTDFMRRFLQQWGRPQDRGEELHGQWRQDPGRDPPVWPRKAQRSGG
jgi:ketosteroid isomerase-like protein